MTPDEIDQYIRSVRWEFAKTMPEIPHWYTVKAWQPARAREFESFVRQIQHDGYDELFMGRSFRYLNVGEYKYWTMDDSVDETDLINRARIDKA